MNLPTDRLSPGMELAADVRNVNQLLLLGKGAILTDRHLRILKTWGIESVSVVADRSAEPAPAVPPDLPGELLQEAADHVARRFRLVRTNHAAVARLRQLATERRARQLMEARASAGSPRSPT